jgi:hypothetical protein
MKSLVLATLIFAQIIFLLPVVAVGTAHNSSPLPTNISPSMSASLTTSIVTRAETNPTTSITGTGAMIVTSSQAISTQMMGHNMKIVYSNKVMMTGMIPGISNTIEHAMIHLQQHTANVAGKGNFTNDYGTASVIYHMKINANGKVGGTFTLIGLTGLMAGITGHGTFQGMYGQPLVYTLTLNLNTTTTAATTN